MTDIFASPSGGAGAEVTIPRTCRWEFGMLIISAFQVGNVSKFGIGIRDDAQDKISQEERTAPIPTQ